MTKPRRIRQAAERERQKAALDLMALAQNAREQHLSGIDPSKPIHGIAHSEHTVFINDQTVTSSTVEELNAMQKMAQEMNDRIEAEMKRRGPGSASEVPDARGPSASPNPQGSWNAEHSGQAQTGRATGSQAESTPDGVGSNHGSNDDQERQQKQAGGEAQNMEKKPTHTTTADGDAEATTHPVNDDESTVAQIVSDIVETAVSSVCDGEATPHPTPTNDTAAKAATANIEKKMDQEPATMESALTPVSEAAKDGDEVPAPMSKANPAAQSGIETPETETNMPDREEAVSPAGDMELD